MLISEKQAFGLISLDYYAPIESAQIVHHLSNLIHLTNYSKEQLKYEISLTLRNMHKNLLDSDAIHLVNMAMFEKVFRNYLRRLKHLYHFSKIFIKLFKIHIVFRK